MDERVGRALSRGHRIDITTTGRRTGMPRRIEIVFHNIDGRIYISGLPRANRTRAWIHNLSADPHLTFHLKGAVQADLPATARIVVNEAERRRICEWIVANAWPQQDAETMAAYAPLIEITFADRAA